MFLFCRQRFIARYGRYRYVGNHHHIQNCPSRNYKSCGSFEDWKKTNPLVLSKFRKEKTKDDSILSMEFRKLKFKKEGLRIWVFFIWIMEKIAWIFEIAKFGKFCVYLHFYISRVGSGSGKNFRIRRKRSGSGEKGPDPIGSATLFKSVAVALVARYDRYLLFLCKSEPILIFEIVGTGTVPYLR